MEQRRQEEVKKMYDFSDSDEDKDNNSPLN